MYTIEPIDHWRAGDRAFCIRGLRKGGRQVVEAGRVYLVAEAEQYAGMMNDGLRLAGIDTGDVWGFWSGRFVCLRGRPPFTGQIADRTRHGWYEAYRACTDARAKVGQPPEDGQ